MTIKTIKDLKVYELAFDLSMQIFTLTTKLPSSEKYSLTDQIIRSSRSVAANIREGYAKREYPKLFIKHLIDAMGSAQETRTWLEYVLECNYEGKNIIDKLDENYDQLGAKLYLLIKNWKKY